MPILNVNVECQCRMSMSHADVEGQCPNIDFRLSECSCFVHVRVRAERMFVFGACSVERMFSSTHVRAEHLFVFGEHCSGPALRQEPFARRSQEKIRQVQVLKFAQFNEVETSLATVPTRFRPQKK